MELEGTTADEAIERDSTTHTYAQMTKTDPTVHWPCLRGASPLST